MVAMHSEAVGISAAIQQIVPVIEQYRDEAEQGRRVPDAVIAAMREAGLLRLWTPKEYGGDEVDLPVFMAATESVARVDSAAGWVFGTGAAGALLTAFVSPESARQIYSNGPDVFLPGAS